MAAFVGLGLLLAFQRVVAGSVADAEQRHAALAALTEGTWRCKLMRSGGDRAGCLSQLVVVQQTTRP